MELKFAPSMKDRARSFGMPFGVLMLFFVIDAHVGQHEMNWFSMAGLSLGILISTVLFTNSKWDVIIGDGYVEGPVRQGFWIFSKRQRFPTTSIDVKRSRYEGWWKSYCLITDTGEEIILVNSHLTKAKRRQIIEEIARRQGQDDIVMRRP